MLVRSAIGARTLAARPLVPPQARRPGLLLISVAKSRLVASGTAIALERFGFMPRYYFDIESGQPYRDEIGEYLLDDQAAWRTALRRSREIEDRLAPGGTWRLQVSTDRQAPLFKIEIKTERVETTSQSPDP
ncbi:hypothetical protein V1280_004527 [Bradyrhizobium sp. AZCC 2230]